LSGSLRCAPRNGARSWFRAFEIAGRTGSFTAAALESNVTQASISQRISNLERRIGSRLFVRNAHGVTLSVQGEACLPYVSAALRSLDESFEELSRHPARRSVFAFWIIG
jgi:LysR family glycine cleavage system transcriptional activator